MYLLPPMEFTSHGIFRVHILLLWKYETLDAAIKHYNLWTTQNISPKSPQTHQNFSQTSLSPHPALL